MTDDTTIAARSRKAAAGTKRVPHLPCTGAFVRDRQATNDKPTVGIVRKQLVRDDGSVRVRVEWLRPRDRGVQWHDPASLRSGLSKGQTVYHRPPSIVSSTLGIGETCALRILGQNEQALVDFPESGRQVWLPAEHLAVKRGVEHLFLRGRMDPHGGAERFRLRCLAYALELWNENTGALSHLNIDPLPHQIHLVRRILQSGNLNWLIADDVGLGKTIEVGMLLSALGQRGIFRRILIICPAGLTQQWQDELRHKFGFDDYRIYGRDFEVRESGHWKLYDRVIGSVDRFKQPDHLASLLSAEPWDLVIIDEAHRLSRRQYGNKFEASQRFGLARELRSRSDNFLFLSATPHQGMQDKFRALLELLRPERKHQIRTLDLNPEILQDMVIRNNKADVTDADGEFIFKGKTTSTVSVPVGKNARAFDKALQSYLRRGYAAGQALGREGRAIGFVMAVYRKLAASSVAAIHAALERRLLRLSSEPSSVWSGSQASVPAAPGSEDFDQRFAGEYEERFGSTSQDAFFDGEEDALRDLIAQAAALLEQDRKLEVFVNKLVEIIERHESGSKVLVFTEYRATQSYLKRALEDRFGSGCVELIHGGQSHDERRAAIADFEHDVQFLVSTEAGGEGINLHSNCHIMVNYDLPWNPMRLVQRIGRLYRYGQKERVIVFNIHAPETIDAQVVGIMYERLQQVVQDMAVLGGEFRDGMEDDILGSMADLLELDIEHLLENARGSGIERSQERIDEALRRAREAAEHQSEVFSHVARYDPDDVRGSLPLDRRHVRVFVEGMFEHVGIEVVQRLHQDREWDLRVPENLLRVSPGFRRRLRATLDREWAERHPRAHMLDLSSALMQHLLGSAKSSLFGGRSAVLDGLDASHVFAGVLRWQNNHAQRMRQEFVMLEFLADGDCSVNSSMLSEWLIEPPSNAKQEQQQAREQQEAALAAAKRVMDRRLAESSNPELHPENCQWVGAGWV